MTEPILTAWRSVHPDGRSSNGFRWPFHGEAVAPLPEGREFTRNGNSCPSFPGDGLCLAKTWQGAASGGIPAITCLDVTYRQSDVLAEDAEKIRVSRCRVVDVFDAPGLIRDGWMAGAYLFGADLSRADLSRADLSGADLSGANLSRANLTGAYLYGAYLYGANLSRADLSGADLCGADLSGADLSRADLSGANLSRAYGRDDWDALVKRGAVR